MKKLILLSLLLSSLSAWAQPDDEIVYYTDSKVSESKFRLHLNANPYYTDMRLINDDAANSLINSFNEDNETRGGFAFNFGLDLFYELAPSFHVGLGVNRAFGRYTVEGASLDLDGDGIYFSANDKVEVSMISVPLKVNFNTSISDVFSLEVIPMVEMNFLDSYVANIDYSDPTIDDTVLNLSDDLRAFNWTVGLSLGGTYWFSDNWGVFMRASAKYMLNDMIAQDWPRETLINFGGNLGLQVKF
tara:strand:- start:20351 stop:21085 length:735 start_codon:yes stop_codon:yes gene_type:complete